ncbi:MAG TPA: DUF1206 domain-containing protein [Streptosporangiaceae bacterium]|nr:DUF1206 domain-containing protein [Streptosporangiaceae bacterium]
MVARSARRKARGSSVSARRAARRPVMSWLARAGLAARGAVYVLIGWIALEIAFGTSHQQADSSGALRTVGRSGFGVVVLWLIAIGFIGLTLWRLSEAAWGAPGPDGNKATTRLASLGRAVIYGVLAFTVLKYALGLGAPSSTNKQSKDLTAQFLHHPGGQVIVALLGVALAVGGAGLAYSYWKKKFLRNLRLGAASMTVRHVVTRIGQVGGVARGAVFVTAGIFLFIAAITAKPGQARGIDSALRALARTPLGPWLLGLVAIGLVLFGIYSWCEARWRAV